MISSKLVLSMIAVLGMGACATASPTKVIETTATYEVPVPDNLKDVATFELDDVYKTIKPGSRDLRYVLPLEITGVKNEIKLHSDDGKQFSGPNADAVCARDVCNIKFKNLSFDRQLASNVISAKGFTGQALDRRLAVFDSFSGDPAGIIRLH